MASFDFDKTSGKYHLRFRFGGKPFKRSLGLANDREAERVCGVIEETAKDIMKGRLTLPPGADPGMFLISGGKLNEKPKLEAPKPSPGEAGPMTIGQVFATYQATLTPGSKERNTLATEQIHAKHVQRILGQGKPFDEIRVATLQGYVNDRSKAGISRDTIVKELATIRTVWGWAHKRGIIASPLSWKMADLTLPKANEKPPFQTWEQIARKVARGGVTEAEADALWESLWLNQAETLECLTWVREHSRHAWVPVMFAFAAYTGTRRGEMLRSERDDWDLEAGTVVIRQKKADRSRHFTRRSVPVHPDLAAIMTAWFKLHPGSAWTLCTDDDDPITEKMASKQFRAAVAGGKWQVIRGYHTFRHSLASNMAVAGADQRDISAILGHHTEEMERRYRHLCPKKQASAIHGLFQASL